MNVLLLAVALLVCEISPLAAILWPPRCYRKVDIGTCDAVKLRWFYEPTTRQCKMFAYSGCGGNWNRFRSERGCLQTCQTCAGLNEGEHQQAFLLKICPPSIAIINNSDENDCFHDVTSQPELSCSAKPNPGNCKAYRPMWYFDAELGYCRGFVYGGCGGNRNTYPNCRACMSRCTNYNPHLMCQYLEFEFFKKFIAGKLIVAPPPVTTLRGFPQGQPMTNVAQPTPVPAVAQATPVTQPTSVTGYAPAWKAAVPSGVRSALRVEDTLVKSS